MYTAPAAVCPTTSTCRQGAALPLCRRAATRDCRDLDLVLRDLNGRELIADRDYDDFPGFTFSAPYTGTYQS